MFFNCLIKSCKKVKTPNLRYLHKIKDLYSSYNSYLNTEIEVCGWIRNIKKQKLYNFMHIHDSSDCRHLQIIFANSDVNEEVDMKNFNFGASIKAKGVLVKSTHDKQDFELLVNKLELVNSCDPEKYPFQMKKNYDFEFLRKYPHLRSNLIINACILRARNHINNLVHKYFQSNDLVHIHTPILTTNDCEGGCELFEVSQMDKKEKYFENQVYLTPSAQLHLEAVTNSLGNVYTISPAFRAEKAISRHHLTEFYMIEAELINMNNIDNLLDFVEDFIKNVCLNALEAISNEDLNFIYNYTTSQRKGENFYEKYKKEIKEIMSKKFLRLSYDDALELINKQKGKNVKMLNYGEDLGKEHEKFILNYFKNLPVFLIKYPKSLKPFYMRNNRENSLLVDNFDLLVKDVGELAGGSLREYDYDVLLENMKSKKMNINNYELYLETKQFGGMRMGN